MLTKGYSQGLKIRRQSPNVMGSRIAANRVLDAVDFLQTITSPVSIGVAVARSIVKRNTNTLADRIGARSVKNAQR